MFGLRLFLTSYFVQLFFRKDLLNNLEFLKEALPLLLYHWQFDETLVNYDDPAISVFPFCVQRVPEQFLPRHMYQ